MLELPPIDRLFPANSQGAIVRFWLKYWFWFLVFIDEGGRLFSAGEFSRTYFLRSLSRTPERVPPRFPPFARLISWLRRRGR